MQESFKEFFTKKYPRLGENLDEIGMVSVYKPQGLGPTEVIVDEIDFSIDIELMSCVIERKSKFSVDSRGGTI